MTSYPVYAALWDMDGVLVDTAPFHFQVWSKILEPLKISFSWERFISVFGMDNQQTLTILLGDHATPDLIREIGTRKEMEFRRAIRGNAKLMPGVLTWLEELSLRGVLQAIASSASPANVDALVDELGIRAHFQAIVSGAGLAGKPDPAIFLKAAQLLGLSPPWCVVIEDSISGLRAARRAGMRCIAITSTNPAHVLAEANLIVSGFENIPVDLFFSLLQ